MRDVFVIDGCRTAVGTFGGSLRDLPAAELGGAVIRAAVGRAGTPPEAIDDVIFGCVGQVAEDAYLARAAAMKGGLPAAVTAMTVNRICGSGLQALISASQAIRAEDADLLVAGGAENMSRLPFYLRRARWGQMRLGHDRVEDGVLLALTDPFGCGLMGDTAEAVAERYGVSRREQDEFAAESHRRALAASDAGLFRSQIVPVDVPGKRGETHRFEVDEHPRRDSTLEALSRLRPAFGEGGTVTAGNSSGMNDAAAALVVASEDAILRHGLKPRLRYVATGMAGVEPRYMGYAPALAIPEALRKAGLAVADLDVVELNEAFASPAVAVIRDTGLDRGRTNPNGGAIALGHPLGATAAILVVKLMNELERRQGRYGLVSMCIGGGQALATILERVG